MTKTPPLMPIALGAFAVVAFLVAVDFSIQTFEDGGVKNNNANNNSGLVACTMEAQLCPDGSYVGRSGPKCEFGPCPTTNSNTTVNQNTNTAANQNTNTSAPVDTAGWKTFSDASRGFAFSYPASYRLTQANEYVRVERGDPRNGPVAYLGVTVYTKDSGDVAVYEWGKNGFSKTAAVVEYHANPSNVKIGSRTFVHADGDPGSSGIPEYFYFANDRLYHIYSYGGAPTKALHEQMISTFTFSQPNSTAKSFTSPGLGISFLYGKDFAVKEDGNKVYVYDPKTMKYSEGQWVEIFTKTAAQTLAQAVKAEKLVGYEEANCYMKKAQHSMPAGWEFQVIAFPENTDVDGPSWANGEKCPISYTATNWIGYFGADPAYPTKYFFFSIGQYAIPGSSATVPWQDTVKTF